MNDEFVEAISLYTENKLDQAEALLYHILENGPTYEVCYAIGNCYSKRQDFNGAKRFYEWALSFKTTAIVIHEIGILEMRFGNINTAIESFRRALRIESSIRHLLYYNLAICYDYKGFPGQALANLDLALANKPSFIHAVDLRNKIKSKKI